MLQRKQSLLIIIVILIFLALFFLFPLRDTLVIEQVNDEFRDVVDFLLKSAPIAFFASLGLAFLELFLFSKRRLQLVLGRCQIGINLYFVALVVFMSINVSGGVFTPEKGIWVIVLVLNSILLAIANRLIRKDDNLVKSIDRIR